MSDSDLIAACNKKDAKAAKAALDAGANPNARDDKKGDDALYLAIALKTKSVAKVLVERGADLKRVDRYGMTPLIQLADTLPDVALGKLMIEKGADVNALCTKEFNRVSALHLAVKRKKLEFAEMLLANGADIDIADGDRGYTPLLMLCKSNSGAMSATEHYNALFLLERGADPMKTTDYDETALHLAAGSASVAMIDALVARGAKVSGNKVNSTPLFYRLSTFDKDREVWDRLRELGCDVNHRNDRGETPLHRAQICWNPIAVKYLLNVGADKTIKDNAGKTALDGARELKQDKIIPLLED